jgi:predicted secreted hydrolase
MKQVPNWQPGNLRRATFRLSVDLLLARAGAADTARWTVEVPTANLPLEIEPYLADQKLNVSYAYWEGAVRINGKHSGNPVHGSGYVEMTGYATSMQGQF